MAVAIAAFVGVFVLILSGGMVLFYRSGMQSRISLAINPQQKAQRTLKGRLRDTGQMLGDVVEHLDKVLPKSDAEMGATQQRLVRAGIRGEASIKIFNGARVLTPILLCVTVLATGVARNNPFVICLVAIILGYIAPDFWLSRAITKRQAKIRRGLPDILDLLVICVEAGLSLDQATARTAEEMRKAHPALSDEFGVVALEQHAGRPRSDCWRRLADRTGVDTIRNLVSMLVQSEQFGTSIAKTLRVQSETLRTQRVQQIEEKAAKLSVKLVFPLALFIFPSLFLVTLGPALIIMSESFKTVFTH